jgi:hypothetical protein
VHCERCGGKRGGMCRRRARNTTPFETALPDPFDWSDLGSRTARPEMARLTLARKIATVVLIVWNRGAS